MTDLLRRPWVILLLALILTILSLMPGLKAPFFFDDDANIVNNTAIHITAFNLDELTASLAGPQAGPFGRPISVLSFAVTYYFFGLDAFAYRVINLCIHLINGVLLFWLMTLLFSKFSTIKHKWLPVWIATIWLIHPINFLPVMLSVQRMTLLSALFMLLALISHIKFTTTDNNKKIIWLCAAWLFFWPLSVLSKETGLLFPLYVFIITCVTTLSLSQRTNQHENVKNKSALLFLVLIIFLVMVGMFLFMGSDWLESAYSMRAFSLEQRLMTEARVLWVYFGQTLFPAYNAFAIYHDDFLLSANIMQPITTLISVATWIAVIGCILLKWSRYPIFCFCISWFLIGHLIESTFLPLEIMHEHRNYFPSIGLIIFVSYAAFIFFQKFKLMDQPKLIFVIALMPIMILSFFTWMRASQLGNVLVGLQVEAAQHPQSARANYSAAIGLLKAGYGASDDVIVAEKIQQLLVRSGEADPTFKLNYLSLIIWSCSSDRVVDVMWVKELARRLEFEPFNPGDRGFSKNLYDPLITMPTCLSRSDIDSLFMAGGSNQKISVTERVSFFEYAADYMLIVFDDLSGAKAYLKKAMTIAPHVGRLEEKFKIADKAISGKELKIEIDK